MIYERKQNVHARRGTGKGHAAGLGQTAGKVNAVKRIRQGG